MKELFSSADKSAQTDTNKFCYKKLGDSDLERLHNLSQKSNEIAARMEMPKPLKILQNVFAVVILLDYVIILMNIKNNNFVEMLHKAPIYFAILPIFAFAYLGIYFYGASRKKDIWNTENYTKLNAELDATKQECYTKLGVPELANNINIFSSCVSFNGGGNKKSTSANDYILLNMRIYADNENLYLADTQCVYAIGKNMFRDIKELKRAASFDKWTKLDRYNSDKYKKFNIKKRGSRYSINCTYEIIISAFGEDYKIIVPNFELNVFLSYFKA